MYIRIHKAESTVIVANIRLVDDFDQDSKSDNTSCLKNLNFLSKVIIIGITYVCWISLLDKADRCDAEAQRDGEYMSSKSD